jgi:hypothetical protein
MKTQINDLEKKINDLVLRMNNADSLTENATTEINSLRSELEKVISEFNSLKIKMHENSDDAITQEMIDSLVDLIDEFITDCGTENFRTETFSGCDIDDVDLSINYHSEIELENATIDINDYFCSNFSFEYDRFIQWINDFRNTEETIKLSKLMSRELFELITEIFDSSVRKIDTSISFRRFEDFECEMDSYKKIEVTEVTIDSDEFVQIFNDEFDFDRNDIEDIIKNYHNFKSEDDDSDDNSEENSDDNSEENNSEE